LNYWAWSVHGPWDSKPDLVAKYAQKAEALGYGFLPTYGAMVEVLDDNVGRLTDALDDMGILEKTITVFTSDNGANEHSEVAGLFVASNHPLRGGKASAYEGGAKVPLSFTWPGVIPDSTVTSVLFQITDFVPTILELISVDFARLPVEMVHVSGRPASSVADLRLDGFSHRDVLLGITETGPRTAVYQYAPIFMNNDNIAGVPFSSIIVGDMKLIRLFAPDSLGTDRFELYDLSTDTGEAFDLLLEDERAHWETVGNMNATLGDWLEQRGALIPGSSPRYWA